MWTYFQSTGELLDKDKKLVGKGYSGHGLGLNAAGFQCVKNVGPIPRGHYIINPPEDTVSHGPYAMALTPFVENDMCGRNGFMLHGDRKNPQPPFQASTGCIILDRLTRVRIWTSEDHDLEVLAGLVVSPTLTS